VPLKDLIDTIERLQPDMVCMSASTIDTAIELVDVAKVITNLTPPRPHFGYGGRAFNLNTALTNKMPGTFLGENAQDAVGAVADIIGSSNQ
jgi:methanogenic corrinoid protein MtbC1